MKNKPLMFIVLGILHLTEPLVKLLYFKAATNFPMLTIIDNVLAIEGVKQIFDFWFLFPLAGLALLSVKKWSYPVFVSLQAYSIINHLAYQKYTWPYVSETPLYSSLVLIAMNVGIIIYFALPEVRKPFFNKDMRWWEHRRRFNFQFPISFWMTNPNKLKDAEVLNISETGLFMTYHEKMEIGDRLNMNLTFAGECVSLKAEVVHLATFQHQRGLGIRFLPETVWDKYALRKLVKKVSKAEKNQLIQPPLAA